MFGYLLPTKYKYRYELRVILVGYVKSNYTRKYISQTPWVFQPIIMALNWLKFPLPQVYPEVDENLNNSCPRPLNSFITCSDDGTARVWNCRHANSLSQELQEIIYASDNLTNITAPSDSHSRFLH